MDTDGPMPTPIEAALTLNQWFSPAYPVGAFAYAHGLESAVSDGLVSDGDSLKPWLLDVLRHGAGRNDALFLAAAYHAADDAEVRALDAEARAFAASAERLKETVLQGAAFASVTGAVWAQDLERNPKSANRLSDRLRADSEIRANAPDSEIEDVDLDGLVYPVAVGRAARLAGMPLGVTSALYLQAFVGNLVAAAQRLFAFGQTEAQALIHDLSPVCQALSEDTASGDLDLLSGTAFLSDIAAMRHETQYSRIFRT
jgi:urease accessory protein